MADETEVSAPEAPAPSGEPGIAHTQSVVERFGGDPAVAIEQPADEPAREQPESPPTPRSAKEISPGFFKRVSARKRAEQAERERDQVLAIAEAIVAQKGVGAPEPQGDPEPDFDLDPKAWYRWETRNQLRPVVDYISSQHKREEETFRTTEQTERQRAWMQDRHEIMLEAETEYSNTQEGQGYSNRFDTYMRRIFDRNRMLGYEDSDAAKLTFEELDRIATQGLRRDVNPAAYLDAVMRHDLGFVTAQAQAPARQTVSPQLAAHRAAADSGVAGSLSVGGPGPGAGASAARARNANNVPKLKGALEAMPSGSGNWKQRLYRLQNR